MFYRQYETAKELVELNHLRNFPKKSKRGEENESYDYPLPCFKSVIIF